MVAVADLVITVAYFSIPLQIFYSLFQYPRLAERTIQVKKFVILLVLFALFIFLCGTGHLMRCLNVTDTPFFQVINSLTAIISLLTAIYLIPFVPNLLITLDHALVTSTKSRRILNAMYPERVRDRLMNSIVVASYDDDDNHFEESVLSDLVFNKNNDDLSIGSKSHREVVELNNKSSYNDNCKMTLFANSGKNNHIRSDVEEQQLNQTVITKTPTKILNAGDITPSSSSSLTNSDRKKKFLLHRLSKKLDVRAALRNYVQRAQKRQNTALNDKESTDYYDSLGEVGTSNPIADTLPEVSICFMDLCDFTAWSSNHTPIEVFTLLEKIFYAFDEIALSLGVFKLSTVGDCYIAATGITESQEDHAPLLATYAEMCRQKMNMIITSSAHDLGEDVNNISMRFGIHSGTVTAGVLRGHKSRFELFGDTINTASRMESTGIRDRIQVSEETAHLIEKVGGDRFKLTLREDTIHAKGKGHMKTYFLNVNLKLARRI
jgi:class 3 adenylate cyclase